MSYTAGQLETVLEDYHAEEPYAFNSVVDGRLISGVRKYDSWDGLESQLGRIGSSVVLADIGILRLIENIGGEGQGDYAAMVFSVASTDGATRLFRKEGYYASHDGTTWDGDFAEVEAYDKTVTDYREIKSNG